MVITSFSSQFSYLPGLSFHPGKYQGKYWSVFFLKVFTFSYSQICEIKRNFEKIQIKMGNNSVGKKVNIQK